MRAGEFDRIAGSHRHPVRTSSGISGGVTTCSGRMPTSEVTTGRPMACACATTRPSTGGSSAGTTTVSAAANAAGMSRQWPVSRIRASTPLACACLRHEARIFLDSVRCSPASDEHEAAHAAVEQGARDLGQDQSGRSRAPRGPAPARCGRSGDPPGLAQGVDALGVHRRRIEGRGIDAARDDGEPLARQAVALHDRRGGVVRRRDHPVAARQRAGPVGPQPRDRRHVRQRGDQPDRDLRAPPGPRSRRRRCSARARCRSARIAISCSRARALRRSLQRIDGRVRERHPLAAEGLAARRPAGRRRPRSARARRPAAAHRRRRPRCARPAPRAAPARSAGSWRRPGCAGGTCVS